MNILFTGKGTSGSWRIRGEQLAQALRCAAAPNASQEAIRSADIIVAVKKVSAQFVEQVRQMCKRWVLDVVDFYPQPLCSSWTRDQACSWVREQIGSLRPDAVIWPNRQMMEDCTDGRPGFVLYHHHRPGLKPIFVQKELRTLVYEGAERYLGRWERDIKRACNSAGITFSINPVTIQEADAVIAVRDKPYSGYAQHHWKSNVKLANAQGIGALFIGEQESGYKETSTGAELWLRSPLDLMDAIKQAQSFEARSLAQQLALRQAYSVEMAAADLKRFLNGL